MTPFALTSSPGNIDKMLLQFEGREGKLIETLHTMQERNVSQRVHAAVKKTAKLKARNNASTSLTSELFGGDSESIGKTVGWSPTKCSDTTPSKISHDGSKEDPTDNNYWLPESSIRDGGSIWSQRKRR